MKKLLVLTMLATALAARAQTNPVPSFISTFTTWSTSFDSNNPCFTSPGLVEISSGIANQNNQNMEAYFDCRLNVKMVSFGARIYNQSALGTVSGAGGWFGYPIVHYDLRLTPEVEVSWRQDLHTARISPGLTLEKAMTQNTFAQVRIALPVDFHGQGALTPTYNVGMGVRF